MNEQKNKQSQPQKQPLEGNKRDKDMNQQGQKPNRPGQDSQHAQNDMNEPDQPDKKKQIDDNPDETKKKIPNMQNKH